MHIHISGDIKQNAAHNSYRTSTAESRHSIRRPDAGVHASHAGGECSSLARASRRIPGKSEGHHAPAALGFL